MLKARKSKRWISILVTLVFLFSLMPAAAFADTENRVSGATTLPDDAEEQFLGTLTLLEDSDYTEDLVPNASFTVTFPSGVKLQPGTTVQYVYDYDGAGTWTYLEKGTDWFQSGDYTLDITLPADFNERTRDGIRIKPQVTIDGFEGGEIEVVVDGMGSGITSGTYVLGRVVDGDTTATALSVPTIGEEGKGGIIRITENAVNAIGTSEQDITIKLPKGFKWEETQVKVDFLAGLAGTKDVKVDEQTVYKVKAEDRTLTITFKPVDRTQRGIIQITPYIVATRDADYGEIEVELSGDEVSDADLVIAKYADFGVSVTADGDLEEVLAGRIDAKLTKLYFKETVAESFIDKRKVLIEFPDWVKIKDVKVSGQKNISLSHSSEKSDFDIDDNEVEFAIERKGTGKIEFKLEFIASIEADASGDIVAEVSGRAGVEGEVVLGEALPPVEVTAGAPVLLSIGQKNQAVADITITETKDGALMEKKDLIISLPDGIKFSSTPDVEVTEGNLELGSKIDADGSTLTIPIKYESSKPSTIKITGIEVDVDRTIPSGEVKASIKGKALVENFEDDYKDTDDEYDWSFDTSTVVKVAIANVVAPGEETRTASFVIGSSTYVVDGVEYTMDVAPYVTAAGRTFVPVRYLSYALGVAAENIYWDQASQTVTLLKGSTAVQLTIGSNVITVNGVGIAMDVAPEVVDGRTMLPARFVAEVFGATVGYDAATQTVTIDM